MTPLPGVFVAWRLDQASFAPTWDGGEGAFRLGGRWNNPGVRAVYCALDPATAILEVAVHKGFATLDTVAHVLTSLTLDAAARVHVVPPDAIPNPDWLRPAPPSAGQRAFGDALLAAHAFVALPGAVSTQSWNLVFDPTRAAGLYRLAAQERFALDPRLHPPARP